MSIIIAIIAIIIVFANVQLGRYKITSQSASHIHQRFIFILRAFLIPAPPFSSPLPISLALSPC
jgi:hypothetical protein